MDRQEALQLADEHKGKAANARGMRQYWESLYEDALGLYYTNYGIDLPENEWSMQAMMYFGFALLMLRLPPSKQKEINVEIIRWARESGQENELREMIDRYKRQ